MLSHISNREIQVLKLVAFEHSSKQIASKLNLSRHTVDSHKKNLKYKLAASNIAGLVRKGFELGILPVDFDIS